MTTDNYKIRIFDLAQRWRMGLLDIDEKLVLETWYRSLEDSDLGDPVEMSVEKLEMRLHQLFDNKSENPRQDDAPPHPFK
ncbi:hypothetical protein [Mucilaginibacter flavus]|uniref:hypothetical protein n=1 Tax=Mucilaginibacter flavus TaxID=931504 RepID=UPI0025B42B09|nr:hypothetical protein [Mucilaginibacter flavus]MDN3585006.1 hypothetical protein [Mucilaginibacter flavus]